MGRAKKGSIVSRKGEMKAKKREKVVSKSSTTYQKDERQQAVEGSSDDWLSSLVKQVSERDNLVDSTVKERRIRKRMLKKEQRLRASQEKKGLCEASKSKRKRDRPPSDFSQNREESLNRLEALVEAWKVIMRRHDPRKVSDRTLLESLVKHRFQKVKMSDKSIQPHKASYGGIGFARSSYYLALDDPSFIPKFEEEFSEHIEGFFGKQRTKSMKRQLDKGMLWRKLLNEKNASSKMKDSEEKINFIAASDLKVKALIQDGIALM